MQNHLSKSKKLSTSMGNTSTKAEPTNGQASALTPRWIGLPGVDGDRLLFEDMSNASYPGNDIDMSGRKDDGKQEDVRTANEKMNGNYTKKMKRPGRRISVLYRTLADPYHATLMGGVTPEVNDYVIPNEPESSKASPAESYTTQEQAQSPMLNFLLGRQDPSSRYFTRRLERLPDPNNSNDSSSTSSTPSLRGVNDSPPLQLTNYDPHAFELYKVWLHTDAIPTYYRYTGRLPTDQNQKYTWQSSWPLMNAVILGGTIKEPDFTDRVMDLLEEHVVKGVCADKDTIVHVFAERAGDIPAILKQFIVDRCIDASFASFNNLGIPTLPSPFVNLALKTALRRLSRAEQVPLAPDCRYHTHTSLEGCYKRNHTAADIRKKERPGWQREKSRKDSKEVEKNVGENGSESIDGETGQVNDDRVARKQTACTRVGSGGLNGRREEKAERNVAAEETSVTKRATWTRESNFHDTDKERLLLPVDIPGMTRTKDAVHEIQLEPPRRAPPPPPTIGNLGNLLESAVCVINHSNSLAPFQEDSGIQTSNLPAPTLTGGGSVSPHLSPRNTRSKSGFRLPRGLETPSKSEKRTICPGAYPESLVESLRGVTPNGEA